MKSKLYCIVIEEFPEGVVVLPRWICEKLKETTIPEGMQPPEILQGGAGVVDCWGAASDLRYLADVLGLPVTWTYPTADDLNDSFQQRGAVVVALAKYGEMLAGKLEGELSDDEFGDLWSGLEWCESLAESIHSLRIKHQELFGSHRIAQVEPDASEPKFWVLDVWIVSEPSGHQEPFLRESGAQSWTKHAPEGTVIHQVETKIPDLTPIDDQADRQSE